MESIRVKVEDEDKALQLIWSLPSSFKHLQPTLMYEKETLSFEEFTSMLFSEERRLKGNESFGENSAMVVSGNISFNGFKKGTCWSCGQSGHYRSDYKAGKGNGASSVRGSESDTDKLATVTSNDGDEALLVVAADGFRHDRGWVFDSVVTMHSCRNPTLGRKLFDEMPNRNTSLYNAMIRCYISNGEPWEGIGVFVEMVRLGLHRPDNYTYPFVLKACHDLSMIKMGTLVHCRVLTNGFDLDIYVSNSLMSMYISCGEKEAARRVFDRMGSKDVVSWNTMISGYFRNACAEEALMLFDQMMNVDEDVGLDGTTMVSVLPACAQLKDFRRGRLVHELAKRNGISTHTTVRNSLVDMYMKCGCLREARLVFNETRGRDVVMWTAMIGGYVLNSDASSALALFPSMQLDGVRPNSVTMAALVSACISLSELRHGKCIHGWVIRCSLQSDVIVETALIDLYAKCGCLDYSFRVFEKSSRTRMVPWNAMISGYVHNGLKAEAIKHFKQMRVEEVEVSAATLISLLPAYADLADIQQAMNIHCYAIRSGFLLKIEITTSLIDIYSKCGTLDYAHKLFDEIPGNDKDIISWSAIIAAYGMHGHGEAATLLFDKMMKSGVVPNEVTFTSVLHGCSHAGLVNQGFRFFKSMVEDHHMRPRIDHYTCVIDLLGRAGRLREAYRFISTMPFEPNHAVWGALLGACVIHENVELGEFAAKRLFELEPANIGNYVLMSKIYASVGRWEDAKNIRNITTEMGLRKSPGHSLIDVRNMEMHPILSSV
ncbi:hypothetical protein GIB67_007238 [Kingdonia uniflora]|uniref:Pentatricopeptide repeat-containing protein n=1 Tax=Kingdonia uniflora TaxID=39325 RepID=A0A7J7NWY3_9MAGN|nr:hypothetical protein GIB67_007238 [Kingdonia uniflora]